MRGILTTIVAGALTLGAGCAGTPQGEPVAAAQAPDQEEKTSTLEAYNATVPEKERIICKNVKITGTHMYRKSCYTKAQKDEMSEQSKDWLRTRGSSGAPQKVVDPADPRLGK